MGTWKSRVNEEFYINLLLNVLADAYRAYPEISSHEFERDKKTLSKRVMAEGLSFLSKTLPLLDKALLRGLETGKLTVPVQFARKSKNGERWNIPSIFSELFLTIFDHQGNLVHDKGTAVGFLRQLFLTCYKIELPFTDALLERATKRWKEIEVELPEEEQDVLLGKVPAPIIRRSRFLLRRLFSGFNPEDVVPCHGPGAVAERGLRGRSKYELTWYSRDLDLVYPYATFAAFGNLSQNPLDLLDHYKLPGDPSPARIVFVPKDSRGPRIISCEPALLQFLQQGLARKIHRLVKEHPLTRDCVLFHDQLPHREKARSSSIDGDFATIDLADASDRVSISLVKALFPEELFPYFLQTRSRTTLLPSGEVIKLKKFAPMGSALCFPIEALTFWALCQAIVWDVRRVNGTMRSRGVYVYGDDIIVKTKHLDRVISILEAVGLRVNRDKCFYRGKFRESCGMDAFNGEDVSPVRVRALVKRSHLSVRDVYRLSKNAVAFFDRGYWLTAEYIWKFCESIIGKLPVMGPRFPGICRTSTLLPPVSNIPSGVRSRWNKDLQRREIRTFVVTSQKREDLFKRDVHRLFHNLTRGMFEEYTDDVAVPHTAHTKAGWVPVM